MEGTTQGNSTAMVIYAITIIPVILMLMEISLQGNYNTFTAAYADDLTATGPIHQLNKWWDKLYRLGSIFGYYPERSKSWLVIRKNAEERAESIFKHTNIKITTKGKAHLVVFIGTTKCRPMHHRTMDVT